MNPHQSAGHPGSRVRRPITEDVWWSAALAHISPWARRHLCFIGLLAGNVSVEMLESFVGAGDKQTELYADLFGEALDAAGWEVVLDEAARCGFLLAVHRGLYELYPGVSPFLRRQLVDALGAANVARLEDEFVQFYAAWAAHLEEDVLNGQRPALAAVLTEHDNLLRALRMAEIGEQWRLALALGRTLKGFYEASGRPDEWRVLRLELLDCVGGDLSPAAGRERANLGLFLLGSEANDALAAGRLNEAEGLHRRILSHLASWNDPQAEPFTGVSHHQLGLIAEERRQLEQAESCYRQALEIFQQLGLERSVADEHYHLGNLAQERQQLEAAEEQYRQALAIYERRGLTRNVAAACQQLGRLAQARQQFETAASYYLRAREGYAALQDTLHLQSVLTQLGILRRQQGRLAEAVACFGQALELAEEQAPGSGQPLLVHLARAMQDMGESALLAAWHQARLGKPPLEELHALLRQLPVGPTR